jgi:hypothetical protein
MISNVIFAAIDYSILFTPIVAMRELTRPRAFFVLIA